MAKGLTWNIDPSLILDEYPVEQGQSDVVRLAREDARMVALRDALLSAISSTVDLWSTDASVSDVRFVSLLTILNFKGN